MSTTIINEFYLKLLFVFVAFIFFSTVFFISFKQNPFSKEDGRYSDDYQTKLKTSSKRIMLVIRGVSLVFMLLLLTFNIIPYVEDFAVVQSENYSEFKGEIVKIYDLEKQVIYSIDVLDETTNKKVHFKAFSQIPLQIGDELILEYLPNTKYASVISINEPKEMSRIDISRSIAPTNLYFGHILWSMLLIILLVFLIYKMRKIKNTREKEKTSLYYPSFIVWLGYLEVCFITLIMTFILQENSFAWNNGVYLLCFILMLLCLLGLTLIILGIYAKVTINEEGIVCHTWLKKPQNIPFKNVFYVEEVLSLSSTQCLRFLDKNDKVFVKIYSEMIGYNGLKEKVIALGLLKEPKYIYKAESK